MLILTRRISERLCIGEDVVVEVLGIKGNQVRIGIDAPGSVPVHREEIYNRIKREEIRSGAKNISEDIDTSTNSADYLR